jgi:osmotically-inducible protein OsmY
MDSLEVEPSVQDTVPGDEALADAVRRELREDGSTTSLDVTVFVRRGVVHLRGWVVGPEDADNAATVASRLAGVRDVVDEIEVALS